MFATGLDDSFGTTEQSFGARITSPYRQNPEPTYQDLEKEYHRLRRINFDLKLRLMTLEEHVQALDLGDDVTRRLLAFNDLEADNRGLTAHNKELQRTIDDQEAVIAKMDIAMKEYQADIIRLTAAEEHAGADFRLQVKTLTEEVAKKEEDIAHLKLGNRDLTMANKELKELNAKLSSELHTIKTEGTESDALLETARARCDQMANDLHALQSESQLQKQQFEEVEARLLSDVAVEREARLSAEKHLRRVEDDVKSLEGEKIDLTALLDEERRKHLMQQDNALRDSRDREDQLIKDCEFRWKGTVRTLQDELQSYEENTKLLESKLRRKEQLLEEYQVSIAPIEQERDYFKAKCEEHQVAQVIHINRISELEDELAAAFNEKDSLTAMLHQLTEQEQDPDETHTPTPVTAAAAPTKQLSFREASIKSKMSDLSRQISNVTDMQAGPEVEEPVMLDEHLSGVHSEEENDDDDDDMNQDGRRKTLPVQMMHHKHTSPMLQYSFPTEHTSIIERRRSTGMSVDVPDEEEAHGQSPLARAISKSASILSSAAAKCDRNISFENLHDKEDVEIIRVETPRLLSPNGLSRQGSTLSRQASARSHRSASPRAAPLLHESEASPLIFHKDPSLRSLVKLVSRSATPRVRPLALSPTRADAALSPGLHRTESSRSIPLSPLVLEKGTSFNQPAAAAVGTSPYATPLVGVLASPIAVAKAVSSRSIQRVESMRSLSKGNSSRSLRNSPKHSPLQLVGTLASPIAVAKAMSSRSLQRGRSSPRPAAAVATSPYMSPLVGTQASPIAVAKAMSSRSLQRVESMRSGSPLKRSTSRTREPTDLPLSPLSCIEVESVYDRFEAETVTPRYAKAMRSADEMARTLSPTMQPVHHRTLSGRRAPEPEVLPRTLSGRNMNAAEPTFSRTLSGRKMKSDELAQAAAAELRRTLSGRNMKTEELAQAAAADFRRTLSGRNTYTEDLAQAAAADFKRTLSGRNMKTEDLAQAAAEFRRTLSGRNTAELAQAAAADFRRTLSGRDIQPPHRTLSPLGSPAPEPEHPYRTLSPLAQPSPLHKTLSESSMKLQRSLSGGSRSARPDSPLREPSVLETVKIKELSARIDELLQQYEVLRCEFNEKCVIQEETEATLCAYQEACFGILEAVYIKGVESEGLDHTDTIRSTEAAARCINGVKDLIAGRVHAVTKTMMEMKQTFDTTLAHYESRVMTLHTSVRSLIRGLIQERNEARKEVAVVQRCVASLEADIEEQHAHKMTLEDEKLKLEFETQSLRTDLELSVQNVGKLTEELNEKETELSSTQKKLQEVEAMRHTLEDESMKADEEYRQREVRFEELKREFKALVKQGGAVDAIVNGGLEGKIKVLDVSINTNLEALRDFIEECGWGKKTMGLSDGFLENVKGITARCAQVVNEVMALARQAQVGPRPTSRDVSPKRWGGYDAYSTHSAHSRLEITHHHSDECLHTSIARHETKTVSVLVDRLETLCETLSHHKQQRESSLRTVLQRVVEVEDSIVKQLGAIYELLNSAVYTHTQGNLSGVSGGTHPAEGDASYMMTSPIKSLARRLSLQKPSELWTGLENVTPIEPEGTSPIHRHIEAICRRPSPKSNTQTTPIRTPRFKRAYYS
eukprot:TRINITY_DN3011_c0_g1_i1.p1 TRINITY_DN3011_c0_g1~~TRINITY_DN3011_c0_g1_i1.p1  ORF type:complete len:1623 (+),score=407.63 TRINITY_DN3011_c0_g1_i1:1146-6014(+)